MPPVVSDWLDDVLQATAFLTRLPVPRRDRPPNLARAYRAFPLVGAAIGVVVGAIYLLSLRIGLPGIAAAALALGSGSLLTGALHEDGLADVADGFGGGRDKAGKLEVMRDSRIGTYGTLVLLTAFIAKVGALSILPRTDVIAAMIATHALARAPLAVLAATMPYAREGLAASAGRPEPWTALISCVVAVVIGFITLPATTAMVAAIIAAVAAACLAALARRQIGGQSGDVLGAAEQACEVAVLLTLAARVAQG